MSDKSNQENQDIFEGGYTVDFSQGGSPFDIKVDKTNQPVVNTPQVQPSEIVAPQDPPADPPEDKTESPQESDAVEQKTQDSPEEEITVPAEERVVDPPEEEDPNVFYYLAQQFKSQGLLDEEVGEITENIDHNSLSDAYRNSLHRKLEPEIRQEIESQVFQKLQENGVNQDTLFLAKAIENNVDEGLLRREVQHQRYSALKDDADPNDKLASIRSMYYAKGLSEDETQRIIDASDAEGDIDALFNNSVTYHSNQWKAFRQQQEAYIAEQEKVRQERDRQIENTYRQILSAGKVMGETITPEQRKELESALYKTTKSLQGQNGEPLMITEFQEFTLELSNSPELLFYLFKKWKYKDQDLLQVNAAVKKEVENDFLKVYERKKKHQSTQGTPSKKDLEDAFSSGYTLKM